MADLIAALRTDEGRNSGFHERCGLKSVPQIVRMRLLHRSLRGYFGGLSDLSAPIGELAGANLPVSRVYIVENLQTGLCFEDREGAVVFMGLGYGVSARARLPWVQNSKCIYWGDLDTHGFAILNAARAVLPNATSVLMDESTLLRNKGLWVEEKDQCRQELPFLTASEQGVYSGLRQQRWGVNVRLEHERIAWADAWSTLNTLT